MNDPHFNPAALLVDLDGVLVISHEIHAEAYARAFEARGLDVPPGLGAWVRMGRAREEILAEAGVPEPLKPAVSAGKEEAFLAALERGSLPAAPGARDFLETVRASRRKLALVSNSRSALACLDATGLADLFHAVVDGTMVRRRKPHGEPWLLGAEKVGVPPAACIAVEDSADGAAGAREAGIFVVGVGPGLTEAQVDALFPDLYSIPIHRWLTRPPPGDDSGGVSFSSFEGHP